MRARLLDHLTDLQAQTPDAIPGADVAQLVDETMQHALDRARSLALGVLASERYLALHDRLVAAARQPALGPTADEPARDVLPGLVRKAWKRLARAAADLGPDAPDDDWHAARLAAKRTRYAAEAVAPVLGDDAAAFAKRVERVTDVLGEHQDAVQAAAAVQRLAVDPGTANDLAFALGVLAAAERERAVAARAHFAEIWPDVRRSSGRTWMS